MWFGILSFIWIAVLVVLFFIDMGKKIVERNDELTPRQKLIGAFISLIGAAIVAWLLS